MGVGQLANALTPRELSALSAFQLAEELNKIDHDMAVFTQAAVSAKEEIAKAEEMLDADPADRHAKSQIRINRAVFSAADLQLKQLSRRQSRIETLLKTIPT